MHLLAITILLAIAALHLYWSTGGRWPGHDDASLASRVVGSRDAMPSGLACAAVAVGLIAAAALVWLGATASPSTTPGKAGRAGAIVVAALFALRGVGGFFEARFRPEVRALPYHRLNTRLYSPGCLAVAILIAAAIFP